ncbi:hypothetical protein THIOM_001266 [Candidatus Thiomargarita nelsonii]|uniref:Uncharacterized protein n=1 Tax=Candidatus Thiomargarita nelsonii TaxID=1003181 RepID=A0A176S4B6_9GAMM|nr:hypothetical protein THIOM_001266 [Candidatus Thiomargarita nelsonii]
MRGTHPTLAVFHHPTLTLTLSERVRGYRVFCKSLNVLNFYKLSLETKMAKVE